MVENYIADLNVASADASTAISAELTTSWLDFGDPLVRKHLNFIEASTRAGAAYTTLTIYGATTAADFASPITILSATSSPLAASPAGELFRSLATLNTKYRFYKFAWVFNDTSLSSTVSFFAAMNISFAPIQMLF